MITFPPLASIYLNISLEIIHTVSRDLNELLEAVNKWMPIYLTGAIEPYYYPRLRDGVFRRTMFIAPNTAAIVSSSVHQQTDGILNLFLTDHSAVEALADEFNQYLALCRPLMRIFTRKSVDDFYAVMNSLSLAEGNAAICCNMPPLFSMPECLVNDLAKLNGSNLLIPIWKKSSSIFRKNIKKQCLSLSILDPKIALLKPELLTLPMEEIVGINDFRYTQEQYTLHYKHLMKLVSQNVKLSVHLHKESLTNTLLYVKEDIGVVMSRTTAPMSAFVINERNIINAFWDYMSKYFFL